MLEEILGKARDAGFAIQEFTCDKDSSTNAIFCHVTSLKAQPLIVLTIVPRTYTKI